MDITFSYQNDNWNKFIEAYNNLKKQNRKLMETCQKIKEERNEYMQDSAYDYLFKKYVGLYYPEKKKLIVHHFIDHSNIFPYGDGSYIGEYDCSLVKGSWDNWAKDYELYIKCVRDIEKKYEGYVYYIELDNDPIVGKEYQFKFKDQCGNWIEPYADSSPLIELKTDTNGNCNAVITVKI
jgi:hypothetical protein